MVDLIFLGIIPGTHIQVTFGTWLYSLGILVMSYGIYYLVTDRHIHSRARVYAALVLAVWRFSRQALPV